MKGSLSWSQTVPFGHTDPRPDEVVSLDRTPVSDSGPAPVSISGFTPLGLHCGW